MKLNTLTIAKVALLATLFALAGCGGSNPTPTDGNSLPDAAEPVASTKEDAEYMELQLEGAKQPDSGPALNVAVSPTGTLYKGQTISIHYVFSNNGQPVRNTWVTTIFEAENRFTGARIDTLPIRRKTDNSGTITIQTRIPSWSSLYKRYKLIGSCDNPYVFNRWSLPVSD